MIDVEGNIRFAFRIAKGSRMLCTRDPNFETETKTKSDPRIPDLDIRESHTGL